MERKLNINKRDLIIAIKANKEKHILEYEKATVAYRLKAAQEIERLMSELDDGKVNLKLDLVSPIDNRGKYDEYIEMFEMDINDVIEITESEYRIYVKDNFNFTQHARIANASYLS